MHDKELTKFSTFGIQVWYLEDGQGKNELVRFANYNDSQPGLSLNHLVFEMVTISSSYSLNVLAVWVYCNH